jgi:hypothetical protein
MKTITIFLVSTLFFLHTAQAQFYAWALSFPLLAQVEAQEKPALHLTVFPNPTADHAILRCADKMARVALFNQAGVVLMDTACGRTMMKLDLSGYPPGMYWLRVFSTDGSWVWKKLQKV